MLRALALLACAAAAAADMRSTVFAAIIARSGETSNCSLFSSMFAADGVYESPVGSGWKVGPAAVAADCEAWNSLIGPEGNGWCEETSPPRRVSPAPPLAHRRIPPTPQSADPGALYSSSLGNRTSFTLQIRTVSKGGCKTDIRKYTEHRREAPPKLANSPPGQPYPPRPSCSQTASSIWSMTRRPTRSCAGSTTTMRSGTTATC